MTPLIREMVKPEQNQFKPDYDTEAVLVEEMQRMAKQIAEMQDWEAVAADQAMTIAMMQLEQEPVAYLCENAVGHKYFRWKKPSGLYKPIALYTTPPQRQPEERNFCQRCGKRTADLTAIHTCTPPQGNT